MPDNWLMGALAAQDQYNPEEGAYQADLLRAQQPSRDVRLDPGIRRAPGDTQMRPAAETFADLVTRFPVGIMGSVADTSRVAGDVVANKYRHKPVKEGEWSDYDEAMQQILDQRLVEQGVNFGGNVIGAPAVAGGAPGLGSGVGRYNPLLDPERMSVAAEQAIAKRGRGIPTGKDAPGWDYKRPEAEAGSWDDAVMRARRGIKGDVANALEMYRTETNPLMTAADWAEMRKPGFILGSGTRDPRGAAAVQGIKAYHSSPHDFEKFDASKIGTGEGAQVYGHGLYFAENPAVSGQGGQYWQNFLHHPTISPDERAAAEYLKQHGFERKRVLARSERELENLRKVITEPDAPNAPWPLELKQRMLDERIRRHELLKGGQPVGPRTYEVNIRADPREMLDWDKGLHRQSPEVRSALERFGIKAEPERMREFDDALYRALHDFKATNIEIPKQPYDPAGREVYNRLIERNGLIDRTAQRARASEMLGEAGIPGIKYLDQGSRVTNPDAQRIVQAQGSREAALELAEKRLKSASTGDLRYWDNIVKQLQPETSNYVVFDPSIVDILKKYGIAGAAAPMGALAAQDEYR